MTLLLLHYDFACWYGLLGHAYTLVEMQSHGADAAWLVALVHPPGLAA